VPDRDELRSIERQLKHRRDQLNERLDSIERVLAATMATTAEPGPVTTCGSTRLASTIALAERERRQVEWALGRIRSGRHGCCEVCDATLPIEMLRSVPHRVLCDACGGPRLRHEGSADDPPIRQLLEPTQREVSRAAAIARRPRSVWQRRPTAPLPATCSATVMLADLREQLAQRFVDEMGCGGMREAVEHAPRYSHQAERLEREHRQLLERVDHLIDDAHHAGNSARRWQGVNAELGRLSAALVAHQQADDDLCSLAFHEDLGGSS
jgi:RNA polymerase-binding transcription factor DksA